MSEKKRCQWSNHSDLEIAYHDTEWGVPVYDEQQLFEMLMLEGQQAGLSWITILKKRENYRQAFSNFDFLKVAQYDDKKIDELMTNEGLVRHRLKLDAIVLNAQALIKMHDNNETLSDLLWDAVGNKQIVNKITSMADVPAKSTLSEEISKKLKKRGFKFVGPTIVYAYMQAVGLVNDHEDTCFCKFK